MLSIATTLIALLSLTAALPTKRATGTTIRPTNSNQTCLGVSSLANGAPLTAGSCATGTGFHNQWDISPGDNQVVRLSGLPQGSGDWCLDAGLDFTSGTIIGLKIWQCFPGVPQQRWFYTGDKHIAVTGGNACVSEGRNGIFTQGCFDSDATGGNPSLQTWNLVGGSTPPVNLGKQIKWLEGGQEMCLQVNGGSFVNGQTIGVNTCFAPDSPFFQFQQFIYTSGPTMIRTGTNFCIDFGTNLGADGQALKIWQCYPGLAQQQLFITQDRHIAVENRPVSGQCADVRAESGPEPLKPYGLTKRVQSWDCIGGNTNQMFIFPS